MPPRAISFALSSIAVEHSGPRAALVLDFLLQNHRSPAAAPPDRVFHFDDQAGTLTWRENGAAAFTTASSEEMAGYVLSRLVYHLADKAQGGCVWHAACVGHNGRGVLIPGATGAGKTTLAAWLLTRGFHYLTDELVFVPAAADCVHAFGRPLNLRPDAWAALAALVPPAPAGASPWAGAGFVLAPPFRFSPLPVLAETRPAAVIFPQYDAGAAYHLAPLSAAEAGLRLMECLSNARNLPGHGLAEAARLARRLPAYRLAYGGLDQLDTAGFHRHLQALLSR